MLTVYKDSVIYVRETCWAMSSHYLLECTYFTEERNKNLPTFYLRHVNISNFQKMMSTGNLKLLKQLSRFIAIVFSKFQSLITERAPYRLVYRYVIS